MGFLDIVGGALGGFLVGGPLGAIAGGGAALLGGDDEPAAAAAPTTAVATTNAGSVLQNAAAAPQQTTTGSFLQTIAQGAGIGGAIGGVPGAVAGAAIAAITEPAPAGVSGPAAGIVQPVGAQLMAPGGRKNIVQTVVRTISPSGVVLRSEIRRGRPAIMQRDLVIAKRVFRTVRKLDARLPKKTRMPSDASKVKDAISRRIIDAASCQDAPIRITKGCD